MARQAAISRPRSAEPTLDELESALAISATTGDGLERASAEQPQVFYRVAKQLELKISQRDEAKSTVKEVEAGVDLATRDNLLRNDIKITEGIVAAEVTLDKRVKEAREILLALNAEVGQLTALKESFSQRSYALNHLVDLYITHYHSSTSESRVERRVVDRARVPLRHSRDKPK